LVEGAESLKFQSSRGASRRTNPAATANKTQAPNAPKLKVAPVQRFNIFFELFRQTLGYIALRHNQTSETPKCASADKTGNILCELSLAGWAEFPPRRTCTAVQNQFVQLGSELLLSPAEMETT
jgi:hypothetical protein